MSKSLPLVTSASPGSDGLQHYLVCCTRRGVFLGMSADGAVWSNSSEFEVMVTGAALCFPTMDAAANAIFRFDLLDRNNKESTMFGAVKPDITDPHGKSYASVYACMRAGQKPWLTAWTTEMEMLLDLDVGSIRNMH
jgi:hypothetical protein